MPDVVWFRGYEHGWIPDDTWVLSNKCKNQVITNRPLGFITDVDPYHLQPFNIMATSIIFHISYIAYTHSHVALYSEWPYIVVLSVLFLDWPGQDSPSPPPYLWPRAQAQLGRHCVHCKLCRPMPWPQNSLRIPRKGRLEGHYRPLERGTIQVPFCGSLWILAFAKWSQLSWHSCHSCPVAASRNSPLGSATSVLGTSSNLRMLVWKSSADHHLTGEISCNSCNSVILYIPHE